MCAIANGADRYRDYYQQTLERILRAPSLRRDSSTGMISCRRMKLRRLIAVGAALVLLVTLAVVTWQLGECLMQWHIYPESDQKWNCTTLTPPELLTASVLPPLRKPLVNAEQRNFTIVTSYFNLGCVVKGSISQLRGPTKYREWMWPYRHVRNAVVAFFDDSKLAEVFRDLRGDQPTKIVMINRKDLCVSSLLSETKRVFAQPDYPKNAPKSTSAAFVGVMHAKFELVARVIRENPFGSAYFAWMDVGIYRALPADATADFMLSAPLCLRDDSVMIGRVGELSNTTTENVMRNGLDWVAAGFFLARADTMWQFCCDYVERAGELLKRGLANHDQSVIHSMYLHDANPRPIVPLQAVRVDNDKDDEWFYFALQLRRLALSGADADDSCLQSQLFT